MKIIPELYRKADQDGGYILGSEEAYQSQVFDSVEELKRSVEKSFIGGEILKGNWGGVKEIELDQKDYNIYELSSKEIPLTEPHLKEEAKGYFVIHFYKVEMK